MDLMSTAQLLGNFGEFFGAIAVVATLGYLAIQIRQNTRSNYVSRQQAVQHELSRMHEQIAVNEGLAELVARCRNPAIDTLSPVDDERVERLANFYLNTFASIETAHREGQFGAHEYAEYCREFQRILTTYPAFVPKLREIMEEFDAPYYGIFNPLFK